MFNSKIAVFDVETANSANDSICSIGIITVDSEGNYDELYSLVNPETHFSRENIHIHGITPADVADAPLFPEIWKKIKHYFSECLIIGHNVRFDLRCIKMSLQRYNIGASEVYFADTLDISRNCVNDIENHKLNTLCKYFDIPLINYHNALDDSKATFILFNTLIAEYNFNLNEFVRRYSFDCVEEKVRKKSFSFSDTTKYLQELQGIIIGVTSDGVLNDKEILSLKYWADTHKDLSGNYPFDKIYSSLLRVLEDNIITDEERKELMTIFQSIINPVESDCPCVLDSDLTGKKICLTGDFSCMSRKDFENLLSEKGAIVKTTIIKKLDYLIVGSLGSDKWIQGNYGTKVKKAMEYNEKGGDITIVKENDFLTLFEI